MSRPRRPPPLGVLATPRLQLRPFTPADAPFVRVLLNDPDFLRHIGDRGVRTLADAARWLQQGPLASYAANGHGLLLVETAHGAEPAGMCGLIRRPGLPAVDLGYAFLPEHRGRGYAVEAGRAVRDHGHRALGLSRLLAIVAPGNGASIRVLERLGFAPEGPVTLPGDPEVLALYGWEA